MLSQNKTCTGGIAFAYLSIYLSRAIAMYCNIGIINCISNLLAVYR